MTARCKWWTPAQDDELRELMKKRLTYREIGRRMGRSRKAIANRLCALRVGRPKPAKQRREAAVLVTRGQIVVPADVWAERNARLAAPISITGFVMGDPPVGYSARERRS